MLLHEDVPSIIIIGKTLVVDMGNTVVVRSRHIQHMVVIHKEVVMVVVVAVVAYLLLARILHVRYAKNMGTQHVIVGGGILTMVMMMTLTRKTMVRILHLMEWIQTGMLIQEQQITSPENYTNSPLGKITMDVMKSIRQMEMVWQ